MTIPDKPNIADPDVKLLEEAELDSLKKLHDYWLSKRGDADIPDRKDIDPVQLPEIAPYLAVLDVLDGGEEFRIRLFGSELVQLTSEERTGKTIGEFGIHPEAAAPDVMRRRWYSVLRYAVATRAPVFVSMPSATPERSYLTIHAAALPLTKGGTEVAQIIGAIYGVTR